MLWVTFGRGISNKRTVWQIIVGVIAFCNRPFRPDVSKPPDAVYLQADGALLSILTEAVEDFSGQGWGGAACVLIQIVSLPSSCDLRARVLGAAFLSRVAGGSFNATAATAGIDSSRYLWARDARFIVCGITKATELSGLGLGALWRQLAYSKVRCVHRSAQHMRRAWTVASRACGAPPPCE
jgi:hypothetical protein